jgi:anhydro-N-acetylmuramic acid kinase
MIVAGIMTGTSLDAIDVAICDISIEGDRESVTLVSFASTPYPDDVADLVSAAIAGTATMEQLSDLPFELSRAYAAALSPFRPFAIDLIGVHGQTLWHHPPVSTWQGASGPALSALIGLPVVHDFRAADVALGGQGAPLVPIFDQMMLRHATQDRIALNIGGMANITLLPNSRIAEQPNNRIEEERSVRAFDTGPGNVLINAICRRTYGARYDDGGRFARAGVINQRALDELKAHPYFAMEPPKSTGREVFSDDMAEMLYRKFAHPSVPSEDLIATLTELTAWSITDHILRYQPSTTEVIVSGGGVHNTYLMERMRTLAPGMVFTSSADHGVDPDAKEAMCFAYLAARTYHGLPGNIPSVTGASRAVVLGSVSAQTPIR